MNPNKILLEYKGKMQSVKQWSDETGLPLSAIYRRIERKLPTKEILEKPVDVAFTVGAKKVTKNDAEMYLNDLTYDDLPMMLEGLIPDSGRAMACKLGTLIRTHHRDVFDRWFLKEYKPAHEK